MGNMEDHAESDDELCVARCYISPVYLSYPKGVDHVPLLVILRWPVVCSTIINNESSFEPYYTVTDSYMLPT